ncbi:MAG: ComEA protein [Deltaproteobacteria bacterium]|jgi:competence protein ComEA|nr:ComEA protein [Deltaproteobacteria bacterium]
MMTREQQEVVLFLGLLLTFVFFLTSESFSPPFQCPTSNPLPPSAEISSNEEVWVEVEGPVRNRGIYPLQKGKSALEAVEKAGGISGGLSLSPEFAAIKIEKSGLLKVAWKGEDKGQAALHSLDPPKLKVLSIPININTARAEELDILPGVGPKMARAIVDFRESHGKFSTLEDLQKVKGFGPRKFAAIRPHITLTD